MAKSKYERLHEWILDNLPPMDFTGDDIENWAEMNVEAWDFIPKKEKERILSDYQEVFEEEFPFGAPPPKEKEKIDKFVEEEQIREEKLVEEQIEEDRGFFSRVWHRITHFIRRK